ncbi:carbon-nitrogen hydrolase family protein [Candidatus Bathyarchaeota archaeon]|nr:carbon-nitrogen hydrolase family protein [Candidatus Bathyarchaeota archaeon]
MRVATIQARPIDGLHSEKNVPRALKLLEEAAEKNIDLACFPDGYPSTGEKKICKKAQDLNIYVIASILTKCKNGKYCNEGVLISPSGEILGRHEKTVLLWAFEEDIIRRGKELNVFKTKLGNIGVLKCSETLYPEPAANLTLKGADIIFVQANFLSNLLEFWHRILMVRSWENWMPIVAVNTAKWKKESIIYKNFELSPSYGGKSVVFVPENFQTLDEFMVRPFNGGIFYTKKRMCKAMAGYGEEIILANIDLSIYRRFREVFFKNRKMQFFSYGDVKQIGSGQDDLRGRDYDDPPLVKAVSDSSLF